MQMAAQGSLRASADAAAPVLELNSRRQSTSRPGTPQEAVTPARARLGTASASFLLPGPEALCRPRAQRPCRREWRGASAAGAAGGTVPAPGGARPAAATSPVHCRLKASVCWKPGVARFHQAPFGATVSRTQTRTVRQAVPRPWLRGRRQTCARTSRPPCAPPCAGLSCVFASQAPQRSSPPRPPPGTEPEEESAGAEIRSRDFARSGCPRGGCAQRARRAEPSPSSHVVT